MHLNISDHKLPYICTLKNVSMKNLFCFLQAVLICFAGYTQDQISIRVFNNSDPATEIILNPYAISAGSVLILNESKDGKSHISYYKNERFVWKTVADKPYSKKWQTVAYNLTSYDKRYNFMVCSNSGSWVYNVEIKPDDIYGKDHFITQIGSDGIVKNFTIKAHEELGKALQTTFCDEQYFFQLTTDDGNEMAKKKKAQEKLIMNRFSAKDFSYKRIVLDLPPVSEGNNSTFWSFLGQTETEKFLVKKDVNVDAEKIILTIAAIDSEGTIKRTFTIEPKLEKKFIRASNAIKSPISNFHQQSEFDYYPKKSGSWMVAETTSGAYANILFDPITQHFFVYGLFGPKPFTVLAPVQDGFYVMKYDQNGVRQWQTQQAAPTDLMGEGFFKVHATPGFRNLYLKIMSDHSLAFYIQFKKTRYSWGLSEAGKVGEPSRQSHITEGADPYEFLLFR